MSLPILAAVTSGGGGFVVGVLLGACLGYLIGPALRSWQAHREWTDASREVRLADRLLERMEAEADLDEQVELTDANEKVFQATWRTLP